jgi:hypothetical protein
MAARTLYETTLLRLTAEIDIQSHVGTLLSSQFNAAQYELAGKKNR